MPINRTPDFSASLMDMLEFRQAQLRVQPVYLGGVSGSSGGQGTPVGGFVGQLIQSKVAYDTSELSTSATGSKPSLLDNLNHIRNLINSGSQSPKYDLTPANVAYYSSPGASGSVSRGDHVHFHGQLVGGDLHNTFTTGSHGFVPAPTVSTGRYLRDDSTWGNPSSGSGGTVTWPYYYDPANVAATPSPGSSGSYSMGDHVHVHGNLGGGAFHTEADAANQGFLRRLAGSSGSYLDSSGNWSVPTGTSGSFVEYGVGGNVGISAPATNDYKLAVSYNSGSIRSVGTPGFIRLTSGCSGDVLHPAKIVWDTYSSGGNVLNSLLARGSYEAPLPTKAADNVLSFVAYGYDGSNWNAMGNIQIRPPFDIASGSNSGVIDFSTSYNNDINHLRMRVDHKGNLHLVKTVQTDLWEAMNVVALSSGSPPNRDLPDYAYLYTADRLGVAGHQWIHSRAEDGTYGPLTIFGDAHSVFTSGCSGLVPAPTASSGRYLKDDATWDAPTFSTPGYYLNPSSVSDYNSKGTSGSFSIGDHTHFHGNLVGGDYHSVFTSGSRGFVPPPTTSGSKFLRDDATWQYALGDTPTELAVAADYSSSSDTFVDVDATNLQIIKTTHGGKVLMWFTGRLSNSVSGAYWGCVDFSVDGTRVGGTDGICSVVYYSSSLVTSAIAVKSGLSSGSHSFKLQYKRSGGGTATLKGSTENTPIRMGVIEFGG